MIFSSLNNYRSNRQPVSAWLGCAQNMPQHGIILLLLSRRGSMITVSDSRNKTPPFSGISTGIPLLAFSLLAFLINVTGYTIFEQYKKSITEQEVQNLGAIADLKVAQITAWRETHKQRAEMFLHGSLLPDEVDLWLREGAPADERKQKILKVLAGLLQTHNYKTITLLDKEGATGISTNDSYAPDTEEKKTRR